MSKPWNPKDPPMSLRESENLLAAESYRLKAKEENGVMARIGVLVAVVLTFIGALVVLGIQFVNWLAG